MVTIDEWLGMKNDIVTPSGAAADATLEELLAFERLLFDLSARFANVAGEQVVVEIENTLKHLLKFLGFDRSSLAAAIAGGEPAIISSVAVEGMEPLLPGPLPAHQSWFTKEIVSGRTVVIRSYEDFPPEAAAANFIAASVSASYLSSPFGSAAASLRRSGLARSAPRANGQTSSSAG